MSLEKLCPLVKPATGENARAGEVVGIRSGCGDPRATRAGWILGDFPTHERFVRDLVADSGFTAVFVNYSPSPEARYRTAINEGYAATKWVAENGNDVLRGRRRSLRPQTRCGGRGRHRRTLRRTHPRLRLAERPQPNPACDRNVLLNEYEALTEIDCMIADGYRSP